MNIVVSRAGRTLSVLQRNLKHVSKERKEAAYKAYITPILEIACHVWDPSYRVHISAMERIQYVAARFVLGRYDRFRSTTEIKKELGEVHLNERRKRLRLK